MLRTHESRVLRWKTLAYASWGTIGVLLLVGAAGWLLLRISGALAPFVIAFLFVFALQSPVAGLHRRGISRGWATAIGFAVGFVAFSVLVVFIAPLVGRQMVEFASAVPDLLETGRTWLLGLQAQFTEFVIPNWLSDAALSVAQSLSDIVVAIGNTAAEGVISAGSGLATGVFDLFLGVVIAFWTLKDLPKIKTELATLAGEKYEQDLENLATTVGRMVGGYLKGQSIASVVTGTVAGIGLALIGVPFAFVLGIITTVFNFVPYVGPLIAGVLAALLGLFEGPLVALGAIVVVLVAQNATDALITPRVMSEHVDLHPTLVIFSLLVGGSLFGFWGMIFSIPVAATGKALFVYYYEQWTSRRLATEDGALFRTPSCDDDAEQPCLDDDEAPGGGDA